LYSTGKELAVGLKSGLVRVFDMALPYPKSTVAWRSTSQGTAICSLNWNEYDAPTGPLASSYKDNVLI
jgi:hypothetical protein